MPHGKKLQHVFSFYTPIEILKIFVKLTRMAKLKDFNGTLQPPKHRHYEFFHTLDLGQNTRYLHNTLKFQVLYLSIFIKKRHQTSLENIFSMVVPCAKCHFFKEYVK